MHRTALRTFSTALLSLAAFAAPAVGHAQVRATAHLGVERLVRGDDSSALMQLRAEVTVSRSSWFDVGGSAQHLQGFGVQGMQTGWGAGVLAMMRPLPAAALGPLVYGSLGYQRAPDGVVFRDGAFVELGAGLAWRPAPVLDLEARGGFVGLLGGQSAVTGFTAGVALPVHP